MSMSPHQIELARHALGLSHHPRNKRSYRNRYFVMRNVDPYAAWLDLCAKGLAEKYEGQGQFDVFALTRLGAESVLRDGETLDPEDFPINPGPAASTPATPTSTRES